VSFRTRLVLFFLLIVVIPVAAIALLVVDVSRESEEGKADARLSTGLTTALEVYENAVRDAEAAIADLVADPEVRQALQSGDPGAVEQASRTAAPAGVEWLAVTPPDGEEIVILRDGAPLATQDLRANGSGGSYDFTASVTSPTEYVEDVRRLTGLDVALVSGPSAPVGARVDGADIPTAGESGDVEVGGETLRAATGALPEVTPTSVVVLAEPEEGGFFESPSRIVVGLIVFLGIALAFIALLVRTLQGQIGSMLDAARRIGSGDFSGRVPVVGRDEMAGLASEFNDMSDRLEAQIEQLRRQRTELDRSVLRLGDAVASGLDQDALLGIVADAALGGCSAEYAAIALDEGGLIERPEDFRGPARVAAQAGARRAWADASQVIARRETGQALAAPLARAGEVVGTLAVGREGREFDDREREVFVLLLEKASTSLENITAHERVSVQAVTDELTGLPNNRSFRETVAREASRAERFQHELSLIIIDLDDFKRVNDTYGHLQGDEVLRNIGEILRSEPRAIDEPARYGGEEFVVALPETGSEGAVELAERIRARLEREDIAHIHGDDPLRVTASFGTATMPGSAASVRELFAAADEALYEAKRQGKNRVVTAPAVARTRQ
jgi:diguanylate cyclase (GGDEF)-like protein